ncbi:MAG: exopolysaccharide biosynthesis polyprenyl glycosylphosphotransferase [Lachnospiraceae bacterium]|nr:exopolysaccharide biosynthesis polyprenyl glycosylphosphotransferase [Lachnospiraceae bacterium]
MKFVQRFKNSIIFVIALLMYLGCMVSLFALLGLDHFSVVSLSRTSVVMALTFILFGFVLVRTYGNFDVGIRKSRPIIISISLAMVLDDIVTYLVLIIMNTNDENGRQIRFSSIGLLLLAMAVQVLVITVMTYLGNGFFFKVTLPERTLVIAGSDEEIKKVRAAVGLFDKRYEITGEAVLRDGALKQNIKDFDSVFIYDISEKRRAELIKACYKEKVSLYCFPYIEDILIHSSSQIMFADLPFYSSQFKGMTFEQRVAKRLMDIIISALMLIVTSPILLIAAIAIKREDGGSVFFRQERATINGRVFKIYKFRTMKENNKNKSVTKDDDRITDVGKILRKYRIDELPQFINIIKGDMSLVGPRPEMLENVREYTEKLPEFSYRLRMKAGLTGYAQIMGKYNTSSRDKLILDLMYIEDFSIAADIKLLLQTLTVLFTAEESTEGFDEQR